MLNNNQPRRPTAEECEQLMVHVAHEVDGDFPGPDEFKEARRLVAGACIAVFDDYAAEGSDRTERIMSVVWNLGLDYYEVFVVKDGQLERILQTKLSREE